MSRFSLCLASSLLAVAVMSVSAHAARPVVPGTGTLIDYVGDNFEDTSWDFKHNFPKSSREQDERLRSPTGFSTNGRWKEGPERGQPDQMQIVPTPAGGLTGSHHALLVRTLNSGIPGRRMFDVQQDDLIANCISRVGTLSPGEIPSVVSRVYLPPADEWENRSGPHFGFRISAQTTTTESVPGRGFFAAARTETKAEPYWPGMWIHFRCKGTRGHKEDSAFITVRGDRMGRDVRYKEIPADQFGWWTLGMSMTGDGQIHYYAKPGVEDLTAADHLTSQFPYSYSAQRFRTFFFDVCNKDDGKSWSTPFVIDDSYLYVLNDSRVTSVVKRKMQLEARRAKQRSANSKSKNRK